MGKWERKFGKYAISNLTRLLIGCYIVGYILNLVAPVVMSYLTLDVHKILRGQIWRLVTWVISPPSPLSVGQGMGINLFFVVIMLFFYYNLGTSLERIWGTWKYNVYIFTGLLVTIVLAFGAYGLYYLVLNGPADSVITQEALLLAKYYGNSTGDISGCLAFFSNLGAAQISTYYINMSIFLAYAATFPNAVVLLMFVIPVKVKWLGVVYGLMLVFDMLQFVTADYSVLYYDSVAAIAASLINFFIFFLGMRNLMHLNPKQVKRRAEFRHDIRRNPAPRVTKHKCAVCGRTEDTNPELDFRFCSKCNGNYEYCSEHLFTHQHVQ